MALQFYCARYPQFFSLTKTPEDGYVFHNALLKTTTVIKDHHPLHVLLQNVPEDFAIMLRNPSDGFYYFRAGMICSALGWNVNTKLGMQLKQIHSPIPDYKDKMEFSMDRYVTHFSSNRTHLLMQRTQLLLQAALQPSHPARFVGTGGRYPALHAARRSA